MSEVQWIGDKRIDDGIVPEGHTLILGGAALGSAWIYLRHSAHFMGAVKQPDGSIPCLIVSEQCEVQLTVSEQHPLTLQLREDDNEYEKVAE